MGTIVEFELVVGILTQIAGGLVHPRRHGSVGLRPWLTVRVFGVRLVADLTVAQCPKLGGLTFLRSTSDPGGGERVRGGWSSWLGIRFVSHFAVRIGSSKTRGVDERRLADSGWAR